jgi:FAD/FMN-containing dehydrogenase
MASHPDRPTAIRRETLRQARVNDVHSRLNATRVARRFEPANVAEVIHILGRARRLGRKVAVMGSGHAMGGQQFLAGEWLIDMRRMNRVLAFDRERGLLEVEAGIEWPALLRHYLLAQRGEPIDRQWGIRQKQTGADRLTVGGAVAANIHGRGLSFPPFVGDIESLQVVTPDLVLRRVDREREPELFRLVVGGYGLFGVIAGVTLRLARRRKVQRVVQMLPIEATPEAFEERIGQGYLYGDYQFCSAPEDPRFLRQGVFSCYRRVEDERPIRADQLRLSAADWKRLLVLSHADKRRAFDEFSAFYRASSGQLYWSDTHQLNIHLESYHAALDHALGVRVPGSEMITELYVPRPALGAFMAAARGDFLRRSAHFIYGTVRLIEPDTESFLPWARGRWACVIFNLHVDHEPRSIARAAASFRRLIDLALGHGGSYYLTYHRYASVTQLRTGHPRIDAFLREKHRRDPDELLQSDWYRAIRAQCAESAPDPLPEQLRRVGL